jgi:hypothetical protein
MPLDSHLWLFFSSRIATELLQPTSSTCNSLALADIAMDAATLPPPPPLLPDRTGSLPLLHPPLPVVQLHADRTLWRKYGCCLEIATSLPQWLKRSRAHCWTPSLGIALALSLDIEHQWWEIQQIVQSTKVDNDCNIDLVLTKCSFPFPPVLCSSY